jgi:hypothetical protein
LPKEGKRPKEGRIVHEGAFVHGRRSFWSLDLRFCREEHRRRPLALHECSLEQLPPIILWRDFIFEEGAWHLQAVCYLEKFLAIRFH